MNYIFRLQNQLSQQPSAGSRKLPSPPQFFCLKREKFRPASKHNGQPRRQADRTRRPEQNGENTAAAIGKHRFPPCKSVR